MPREIIIEILLYCIEYKTLGTVYKSLWLFSGLSKYAREISKDRYLKSRISNLLGIDIEKPFLILTTEPSPYYRWKKYHLKIGNKGEYGHPVGDSIEIPIPFFRECKFDKTDDYLTILKNTGELLVFSYPFACKEYPISNLIKEVLDYDSIISISTSNTLRGRVSYIHYRQGILILFLSDSPLTYKWIEGEYSAIHLYHEGAILLKVLGGIPLLFSFGDGDIKEYEMKQGNYSRHLESKILYFETHLEIDGIHVPKPKSHPSLYCGDLFVVDDDLYDVITGKKLIRIPKIHHIYREGNKFIAESGEK